MAEIIGIIWLTRIVSRIVVGKGYSKWYAAAVPAVWFTSEIVVSTIVTLAVPGINVYTLMLFALVGGVCGGAVVYFIAKNMAPRGAVVAGASAPAQAAADSQGVPAGPAVQGNQALAGYCHECDARVWLMPDGSCEHGHGQDSVSGVYWALRERS